MDIRTLNAGDEERWNAFVDQSAQGSLFNKTWYLNSIGCTWKIYIVERNSEICAGIILSNWKRSYTFGPYQKYTGILFGTFDGGKYNITTHQRNAVKLLLEKIRDYKTFDYFFHPAFTDWLQFYQLGFKETTCYTYRIALSGLSDEDIINLCAPRLRTHIRQAAKDTSLSILEDIDPGLFYSINSKTFERQGAKMPIAKERFGAMYEALKKHNGIKLYGLKANGKFSSVLGIAYDSNTAYLLFSGFDQEHKDSGHTEYLIYTAICNARNRAAVFDFEGSMIPGIESFYRKFGGEQTPYFRIYKTSLAAQTKQSAIKVYKKLFG